MARRAPSTKKNVSAAATLPTAASGVRGKATAAGEFFAMRTSLNRPRTRGQSKAEEMLWVKAQVERAIPLGAENPLELLVAVANALLSPASKPLMITGYSINVADNIVNDENGKLVLKE